MSFQGSKPPIRIIPDQQGRGGSKTSLTTQSINLDIRLASNVRVNYGRWRQDTQAASVPGFSTVPTVLQTFALHNFARFDTSNAALQPVNKLLSHNFLASGAVQIDQHNPVTTIKNHTPVGPLDTVPATFLNIKNRCFICWGATDNFIYTGKVTYDVGIDAPDTAATYTFGGTESGTLFATAGGYKVTFTTGTAFWDNSIKYIQIAGITYPTVQPNPFSNGPYTTGGTASGTAGTNTVLITGFSFPVRDYNGLSITMDTTGAPETHFVLSYTLAGGNTTITIDGVLANNLTGVYSLAGDQLTLATPFIGETSTSLIYTTFSGPLSWGTSPPQYAYAYYDFPGLLEGGLASGTIGTNTITITGVMWGLNRYDGVKITLGGDTYTVASYAPIAGTTTVTTVEVLTATYTNLTYTLSGVLAEYGTGHISNISPLTQVTEQNISGASVVLSDIIPSAAADQSRFNKIQIFRSILTGGGGAWFPLDPTIGLLNNVGVAPLGFTDIYDDSYLLSTGGFQAPTVQNREPPPFAHMAYWDGRVFGNPVNDPSAILYSGDSVQILFGVPEECYPSQNILRIPSDDGRVTGMALMGPLCVIATERYAYYVAGAGSADNPYRLIRFSTQMSGVGDKQMIEFAGPTTDDSDLMAYIGKDLRVYLTAPSVGNISMSDPIQNQFTDGIGTGYDIVRLAKASIIGNNYLVVSFGGAFVVAIYDFDRKIWTDHNTLTADGIKRPEAFTTIYGTSNPSQFLYAFRGAIYEWLGPSISGVVSPATAFVETMPLSGNRKSKHRLDFIRIYVSDATETWKAIVTVDENIAYFVDFIPYPDQLKTIQPTGGGQIPIDNINARELMFVPASNTSMQYEGYRFQVRIMWPDSTTVRDLYAIDINLVDLEPEDQTSI